MKSVSGLNVKSVNRPNVGSEGMPNVRSVSRLKLLALLFLSAYLRAK